MSVIEIYNPKFDDFHGEPVVTWRERPGQDARVSLNLLEQYNRWKPEKKTFKYELPDAFWQSNGPAIVRALGYCAAKALVFAWRSDRKVAYLWFTKVMGTTGADRYHVCSVHAEGGMPGSDTRVIVALPANEEISFLFTWSQMQSWLKPHVSDVSQETQEKTMEEKQDHSRFGEG